MWLCLLPPPPPIRTFISVWVVVVVASSVCVFCSPPLSPSLLKELHCCSRLAAGTRELIRVRTSVPFTTPSWAPLLRFLVVVVAVAVVRFDFYFLDGLLQFNFNFES